MLLVDHDKIAKAAGISKARVRCDKCERERTVDGGACLRKGWPECCGSTMRLITSPKADS